MLVDALDDVLLRRIDKASWFQNPYGGSALFPDVDTCLESVVDVITSLSGTGAVISIGIAWGNFERNFAVRAWNTVALPVNTAARLASIPEIRGCVAVHPKVPRVLQFSGILLHGRSSFLHLECVDRWEHERIPLEGGLLIPSQNSRTAVNRAARHAVSGPEKHFP